MARPPPKKSAGKKHIYLFEEGSALMRDLLGGKGSGLAEMARAGITVPPGFTITTEACNEFQRRGDAFLKSIWPHVDGGVAVIEKKAGKKFGDPARPLLVSVRSGAKFSMPGMMDTVLNLGLNDEVVKGLARISGDERFAYDAYRRFVAMFGSIVSGIPKSKFEELLTDLKRGKRAKFDTDLGTGDLMGLVERFKELYAAEAGKEFPQDPRTQLRMAVRAVFNSWDNPRAVAYRSAYKIPHTLGTAVNVQAMVFGNMGPESGTGVAFTRNPSTGARELYGEFLQNAQGEDVVAGIRTPQKIVELKKVMPTVYRQLETIGQRLEKHFRDLQDVEFTVEKGRLYMLQCRSGKRTGIAAVKIAVDMVGEGLITKEEALLRVVQQGNDPHPLSVFLAPVFNPAEKEAAVKDLRRVTQGINASPGAASGRIVLSSERAVAEGGTGPVILVREETNPDDLPGMLAARGILTSRGGATSHAAVVTRGMGKPCVVGCGDLGIDHYAGTVTVGDRVLREGDAISIDGFSGDVFTGIIHTLDSAVIRRLRGDKMSHEEEDLVRYFDNFLRWADEVRRKPPRKSDRGHRRVNASQAFTGAPPKGEVHRPYHFSQSSTPGRAPSAGSTGLQVWANADMPADATVARELGAQGIGLCRTEHMFLGERTAIVQRMVMADTSEERRAVLEKELLPLQRDDFKGILGAMDGLPVIIRLLDPPLHEFMPRLVELEVEVALLREKGDGGALKSKETLLKKVRALHEANPMLGLRVCRLGIVYPEIYETQIRAIFEAAAELKRAGMDPRPQVMFPGVGHVNEMTFMREMADRVHDRVEKETGVKVPTKIGTMLEIPRACVIADHLAETAEFFSFGTNDLTQMTWGYSRDDAEGKFLPVYLQKQILKENPFATLDTEGVGDLMARAVGAGRKARKGLSVGICGEHGGDPASIEFCHGLGLNYVSCSPYRVPVARLAAAQAVLNATGGAKGAETR